MRSVKILAAAEVGLGSDGDTRSDVVEHIGRTIEAILVSVSLAA